LIFAGAKMRTLIGWPIAAAAAAGNPFSILSADGVGVIWLKRQRTLPLEARLDAPAKAPIHIAQGDR
jgi:hypothetical protein